jgi:hypothetical protein
VPVWPFEAECGYADREFVHLARVRSVRIAIDFVLVAVVVVLAVAVLGIGASHPNQWAIAPGSRSVNVTHGAQCLSTKLSVAHVARTGSTGLSVTFRNGATVRLLFFRRVSTAWRLAPVSYAPFLTRSSLSNVVIARPGGSTQPPHASLFALGPCLLTS